MMGRDGIKLMHKKRNGELSFPSHMGYGYHGDNKKDRYKPAINLHSTP
jgi:hypothetical protein